MNLNIKRKPVTKPHQRCKANKRLLCKNVDDYYGDMICECVSQRKQHK